MTWLQDVDPFDSVPQFLLFLEIHPVSLIPSFNQDTNKREQKLHILRSGWEREGIDREIARLAPDI